MLETWAPLQTPFGEMTIGLNTLAWVLLAVVALIFFAQYGGQLARRRGPGAGVPLALASMFTSVLAVFGITNGWIIWSASALLQFDPAAIASVSAYMIAVANAVGVIDLGLVPTIAVVGILFMGVWVARVIIRGSSMDA